MAMSLTTRQSECLAFIRATMASNGRAPSLQEICDELDLPSKSQVHTLLTALEERGAIRRLPNRARAIELLSATPPADLRALADTALDSLITNALGERLRRRWAKDDAETDDKAIQAPAAPRISPTAPPRPRTPEDGRTIQTPEDGRPVHTR